MLSMPVNGRWVAWCFCRGTGTRCTASMLVYLVGVLLYLVGLGTCVRLFISGFHTLLLGSEVVEGTLRQDLAHLCLS